MIIIRKLKIEFFLAIFLLAFIKDLNCQNAYPNIVSGSGTFLTLRGISTTFNMTYTTPFKIDPTLSCIHTLSGFGFQTANLASQTFFTFYTSLNVCSYTMIGLYAVVSDNYLSSIKFYYLAMSNEQSMTQVVFLILSIIDGQTAGTIRDPNANSGRYSKYDNYYVPQNSTNIVTYPCPCISSLQIGTTNLMHFQILPQYFSDNSTLSTFIFVFGWTYITSITIKVILFNEIQRFTQNSYFTYDGFSGYENSNNEIMDFNVNVTHFDQNYFFTFVSFMELKLDFTNISKINVNGSTQKHFWMQYNNPTTLRFQTNFMNDNESFQGSYAYFYYIVITKYKQIVQNNNTKNIQIIPNSNINQQQNYNSNQSTTIILIVVIILSVLFLFIILIIIYRKCHIRKRLMRKSFTLESCQNIRFQM